MLTVASGRTHQKAFAHRGNRGIALPIVLVFSLLAAWFAAELLRVLAVHGTVVQDDYNYTRALYLAESGLNRASEGMWIAYLNSSAQPDGRITWLEENFETFNQTDIPVGDSGDTYSVRAVRLMETGDPESRYLVFEATGNAAGAHMGSEDEFTQRSVTRVIRYGNDQSSIFDYVYFINNFGWFWGGSINAQGDVRANGDFSFKYNPLVNGDAYASINPDVGANGDVIDGGYRTWDLNTYRNNAQNHWRPTWPEYDYGFKGESVTHDQQEILKMPYLGDFERFEELAVRKGGTLVTGTQNISNTGSGPVFLFGTYDNPIRIDGPVAIDGDVIISGYVEGQGTIYSDRNIHIIGDIIYKNQPQWDHSEGADPGAIDNSGADFLGLASRGSVIVGDYTNSTDWYNNVKSYLKPPFTSAFTDEDGSTHNGDYTATDGTKLDGTARKRYESTFSNTVFKSYVNQAAAYWGHDHKPRRIDALTYTNHLFAGRVDSCNFNGSIISRDEAIVFNNFVNMNYDYRAKAEGEDYVDIDLPRAANGEPVIWLDGPYEDWVDKIEALLPDSTHPEV
jgi:Tfp pilus assembly protein PilX